MLDDLKAFVAVVEKNSVTRAAESLSLTQSAVSRRVKQLEETLGAELLDRSAKPPRATSVGSRVYKAARPVLKDVDRLMHIARADVDPAGNFRLGMTQVVAEVALFQVAMRIKQQFPRLDLSCSIQWSSELQRQLEFGTLDAATLLLPTSASLPTGFQSQSIATLEVVVVQSKRRPTVRGRVSVSDLAGSEWILNPQGCGYRAVLEESMKSVGRSVRFGVTTHGTEMQLRLIAAGLGLGLVPKSLLAQSAHRQELVVVQATDFSLSLNVCLVHSKELGNYSRAAAALREVMHAAFASHK